MDKSQRLLSLDVFRGITIAGMILVNNPGDWGNIYPALEHAQWHGVTPTDLIFPFFIFIMGTAIPFAFAKRLGEPDFKKKLIPKILRRTVILFLLGLILNAFPWDSWESLRIPGVLQRIAVVYFFSSILFLYTSTKTQSIIATVLLFVYWGLMALIPVPGVGYANLQPVNNLGAWIDKGIFGNHVWQYSKPGDPEGILSTLPAIASGIFGMLVGQLLRSPADEKTKTIKMFVCGTFALVLAAIWDMFFPFNKNLWTSSFVLYTTGMALQFLAICYWLIDVQKISWWIKPFLILGTNAIAVYFLADITSDLIEIIKLSITGQTVSLKYSIVMWLSSIFSPINSSLAFAILYVSFWVAMTSVLYYKKIFIKV